MLYLNEKDIFNIGINWSEIIAVVEEAVMCLKANDYSQPIKPYLRYRNPQNRIIAMPAFVGGEIDIAGIKWISSFPQNIHQNKPRAHSVVLLNNADTGEPKAIINTPLLSILRTAGISGTVIKAVQKSRNLDSLNVGIIGWGPIGQYHYKMVSEILKDQINQINIFDIREINKDSIQSHNKHNICICSSWQQAYENADLLITSTVSKERYIDKEPKKGSLLLNVSLRDYKTDIYPYVKNGIIVDDWQEVCRENTDIEMMHLEKGLKKEDTTSIVDVVGIEGISRFDQNQVLMFNPMGMAVFDIAVSEYLYRKAINMKIGLKL